MMCFWGVLQFAINRVCIGCNQQSKRRTNIRQNILFAVIVVSDATWVKLALPRNCRPTSFYPVFPPTLVKEDEALPETADCRMDLTVVLRWGHDGPIVVCNPVLR